MFNFEVCTTLSDCLVPRGMCCIPLKNYISMIILQYMYIFNVFHLLTQFEQTGWGWGVDGMVLQIWFMLAIYPEYLPQM